VRFKLKSTVAIILVVMLVLFSCSGPIHKGDFIATIAHTVDCNIMTIRAYSWQDVYGTSYGHCILLKKWENRYSVYDSGEAFPLSYCIISIAENKKYVGEKNEGKR
jgi:hypothetical protein